MNSRLNTFIVRYYAWLGTSLRTPRVGKWQQVFNIGLPTSLTLEQTLKIRDMAKKIDAFRHYYKKGGREISIRYTEISITTSEPNLFLEASGYLLGLLKSRR
jgi:hypothetical protein